MRPRFSFTGRVFNLSIVLLATIVFSFHAALKQHADPDLVSRITEEVERPKRWRGRVAPNFTLTLLDGSTFDLSEKVGRNVVILNFFATWCGPCRAEMPELSRFYDGHKNQNVVLIGIDAHENPADVRRFIADLKVTFPVGVDSGTIQRQYGVRSYPTTVLIGADGKIVLYETTAILNTDVAFKSVVDTNLALIRSGGGTTKEKYLHALAGEDFRDVTPPRGGAQLTGRSLRIAQSMNCVCGCDDTLMECSCKTAKDVKAKLAKGDFGDKTDAQIMAELNAEFCMKGMT